MIFQRNSGSELSLSPMLKSGSFGQWIYFNFITTENTGSEDSDETAHVLVISSWFSLLATGF